MSGETRFTGVDAEDIPFGDDKPLPPLLPVIEPPPGSVRLPYGSHLRPGSNAPPSCSPSPTPARRRSSSRSCSSTSARGDPGAAEGMEDLGRARAGDLDRQRPGGVRPFPGGSTWAGDRRARGVRTRRPPPPPGSARPRERDQAGGAGRAARRGQPPRPSGRPRLAAAGSSRP